MERYFLELLTKSKYSLLLLVLCNDFNGYNCLIKFRYGID